jgi:dihydrodipicolinate synthase/N-acetylneuraminate lyase
MTLEEVRRATAIVVEEARGRVPLPANVKYCQALQGRPAGVPRAPMPATSERPAEPIRQAGLL